MHTIKQCSRLLDMIPVAVMCMLLVVSIVHPQKRKLLRLLTFS